MKIEGEEELRRGYGAKKKKRGEENKRAKEIKNKCIERNKISE